MDELEQILWRNQGAVLTPELIMGMHYAIGQATRAVPATVTTRNVPDAEFAGHRLVCNDRERVGEWVAERVGQKVEWGGFSAIGQEGPTGALNVGMVLDNITETNATMHVAIADGARLTRTMVHACFDYPFNQLGLSRVTGLVNADNEPALRFDRHLGFENEFVIKDGNGGDVIQLVMWRDRCRWIE